MYVFTLAALFYFLSHSFAYIHFACAPAALPLPFYTHPCRFLSGDFSLHVRRRDPFCLPPRSRVLALKARRRERYSACGAARTHFTRRSSGHVLRTAAFCIQDSLYLPRGDTVKPRALPVAHTCRSLTFPRNMRRKTSTTACLISLPPPQPRISSRLRPHYLLSLLLFYIAYRFCRL